MAEGEAQSIREARGEESSAKERELERKVVDLNARLAAKAEAGVAASPLQTAVVQGPARPRAEPVCSQERSVAARPRGCS